MNAPSKEVVLTLGNVDQWPKIKKLLDEEKFKRIPLVVSDMRTALL